MKSKDPFASHIDKLKVEYYNTQSGSYCLCASNKQLCNGVYKKLSILQQHTRSYSPSCKQIQCAMFISLQLFKNKVYEYLYIYS